MTLIMGAPSTDLPTVLRNLVAQGADPLFVGTIAPELWAASEDYGLDPVYVVAQSVQETGWGKWPAPAVIDARWRNTCGLKVRDQTLHPEVAASKPLAHQQFPSWRLGAIAHVQHLRAYVGVKFSAPVIDPRWDWVFGKHAARHWEDLSGKWAVPGEGYGQKVVAIGTKLIGA